MEEEVIVAPHPDDPAKRPRIAIAMTIFCHPEERAWGHDFRRLNELHAAAVQAQREKV